jgi:hypothetical protein
MGADRPADRPSGMPGNARFAGAGIGFGIVFIVADIAAVAAGNDMNVYFGLAGYAFLPLIVVVVLTLALLNSGKLAIIRALRALAAGITVAYAAAIAVDALRALLYPLDEVLLSAVAGVMLVMFSPLIWLMWRDFRRSRWLDPRSLPHEWEIAAIRDPNSINYRPPKPPKRRADV